MAQYQDFAYVYDRLMHEDIDYDKWCDYIENLFTLHGVSPDTLCELACGTGNMTCRMEKRGYEITASDISSDMLSIASEKLDNTELICSDMSKLALSKKYDAFLCMIDGLNYVITPKAVLDTFINVKKHLNDGGVFVCEDFIRGGGESSATCLQIQRRWWEGEGGESSALFFAP